MNLLKKDCQNFLEQKENETTWSKIDTLFQKTKMLICGASELNNIFPIVSGLLYRSLLSERSRLNGTCIEFVSHCFKINNFYDFTEIIPILIKLTGRSNKVFVNRAEKLLLDLIKSIEANKIPRIVSEGIISTNKRVRTIMYQIIETKYGENHSIFVDIIQKGLKDPAIEVRTICKKVNEQFAQKKIEKKLEIPMNPISIKPSSINQEKNRNMASKKERKKIENYKFNSKTNFKHQNYISSTTNLDKYFEEYRKEDEYDLRKKIAQLQKKSTKISESLKQTANKFSKNVDKDVQKLMGKNRFGSSQDFKRPTNTIPSKIEEFNNSILEANDTLNRLKDNKFLETNQVCTEKQETPVHFENLDVNSAEKQCDLKLKFEIEKTTSNELPVVTPLNIDENIKENNCVEKEQLEPVVELVKIDKSDINDNEENVKIVEVPKNDNVITSKRSLKVMDEIRRRNSYANKKIEEQKNTFNKSIQKENVVLSLDSVQQKSSECDDVNMKKIAEIFNEKNEKFEPESLDNFNDNKIILPTNLEIKLVNNEIKKIEKVNQKFKEERFSLPFQHPVDNVDFIGSNNQNILSFVDETLLFNSEINCNHENSLNHEIITEKEANEIIATSERNCDECYALCNPGESLQITNQNDLKSVQECLHSFTFDMNSSKQLENEINSVTKEEAIINTCEKCINQCSECAKEAMIDKKSYLFLEESCEIIEKENGSNIFDKDVILHSQELKIIEVTQETREVGQNKIVCAEGADSTVEIRTPRIKRIKNSPFRSKIFQDNLFSRKLKTKQNHQQPKFKNKIILKKLTRKISVINSSGILSSSTIEKNENEQEKN